MELFRPVLLVAAVSSATAAAQTPPVGKPFSFRGVELGITIDQFRAFPVVADDGQVDLRARCNDVGGRDSFDEINFADKADGIVSCQWFGRSGNYDSSLFVDLGAGKVLPVFDFIDVAGTKRLFRIRSFANSEYYPAILDVLTRGYGAPRKSTAPFKTMAGAEFTATTSRWSNGLSGIQLSEPCHQLKRYCLTYRHGAFGKVYDALVEKRAAAAASKL